jgi:hypothetical protein
MISGSVCSSLTLHGKADAVAAIVPLSFWSLTRVTTEGRLKVVAAHALDAPRGAVRRLLTTQTRSGA